MDFIDPKKRRLSKIKLLVGYALIGCAVIMTTLVLLYQANGYSFDKSGQLIQKGLVFVSSTPNPANIYLNGVLDKAQTNARLNIPAGQYTLRLNRSGYRPWQRAVGVEGGSVERFDYPFLVPEKLVTTTVQTYSAQPGLALQSPDRRWLLVQQPSNDTSFDEYDLTLPKQLKPTTVTIPTTVAAPNTPGTSWQLVSWSTDNIHILLDRITGGTNDYIVVNRQTPSQTIDLTKTLSLNNTTQPTFDNNHYDQYFLFDPTAATLSSATLTTPQPTVLLEHVLAYKSYGSNVFLYVSTENAPTNEVYVRLQQGSTSYSIRELQAGASVYDLNLTQYNGDWYIVAGDSSEDKTYVYENPQAVLGSQPLLPLVPADILKVENPNFTAFSANAQFIMTENGASFGVYDAQNNKSYSYQLTIPLAAGQHATWMDGDRLLLTSGGNATIFDYDDANQQTLQPAAGAQSYFDQTYKWSYAIAPTTGSSATTPFALTQTSMLIPSDQ
jgi:PEGA domain-containing protein